MAAFFEGIQFAKEFWAYWWISKKRFSFIMEFRNIVFVKCTLCMWLGTIHDCSELNHAFREGWLKQLDNEHHDPLDRVHTIALWHGHHARGWSPWCRMAEESSMPSCGEAADRAGGSSLDFESDGGDEGVLSVSCWQTPRHCTMLSTNKQSIGIPC